MKRNRLLQLFLCMLLLAAAMGILFLTQLQTAKAETASIHVSYKRYTRSDIKFYYYPTDRALGAGLMYKDDGTPTYCIWWDGKTVKNNTLTVTDLEDVVTDQDCLDGLYIIMQNGYGGGTGYTVAGINLGSYGSNADEKEELAYYATEFALYLWMGRYGYEKTQLMLDTADAMTWTASSLRAYGTNGKVSGSTMGAGSSSLSKAAWKAAMELLALAVEGEERTATANVTLKSQTVEGNYNVITLNITTANATGWTLSYSTLPAGSSVSKTSGTSSSETVTVKIPISDTSSSYTFTATPNGTGRYVTDSYQYVFGTGNLQSLVTWNASYTGTGQPGSVSVTANTVPTASLSLNKVDSSTGDKLSGAVFTIQEQVTVNGTTYWYDVGTLTEGSTKGTYDQISLTKYYDTSGTAHSYSAAKTKLVRTQYNSGNFRIKETTAPAGHTVSGSWFWYVQVISSGSWSSLSPAGGVLGGSTSGTYVIGKKVSTGAAWHYIKSGSTAGYTNYAAYDNTANAAYNYGTSLGNSGKSAAAVSLSKVDSITGEALSGAVFKIQEFAAGAWRDVGTLTESSTAGTYSVVSITCHYNSSGTKKTLGTAQTQLVYTNANAGKYRILEQTAPTGYSVNSNWAWYLCVVDDSLWTATSNSLYSKLYTGSYQIICYPASASSALWTYVMSGHGAGYDLYARYNNQKATSNSQYNYGEKLADSGVTATAALSKVDASTGDALSGAVFKIWEQVGSTWYEAGTLIEGSTKGTYNVISITKLHDSSGTEIAVSRSGLVYTSANSGRYKITESTPPAGYAAQSGWAWYIQISPSSTWSSTSPATVLGGSTSGTYIIGKTSASSGTAWHYVKSGNTAYYSHYAACDDTANAKFNYGTKLGNTPLGINVTLTKVDYVTGANLVGAVFTIEEKVNGSWYAVGKLTDKDGDGVYTDIAVTAHYSTNGKAVTLANAQTQLVRTNANNGEYRITETASPDNYVLSGEWHWYVTVVRKSAWANGSSMGSLSGTLLSYGSGYKIAKVSNTKTVHYVVDESTANYANYAAVDVNTDNQELNFGASKLGNRGIPAGLSLDKIDYGSEEPLSGVTFEIQEYVDGTWYTVGTLGESETAPGTYDVINITKHYYVDAGGTLQCTTLAEAEDVIRYTSANGGLYRVVETEVPLGYALAEDWAWYAQVSSRSTLKAASGYGDVLGGSDSDGYKVVGLTGTVFAVYSVTDHSLTFYYRTTVPTVNSTYEGKAVTAVYTGFDTTEFSGTGAVSWYAYREDIETVVVEDYGISPTSMQDWFFYFTNCKSMDLAKLDTSKVTNMTMAFHSCSSLGSLDVSTFDTSSVKSMTLMFYNCSSLKSLDVSAFDTSSVETMENMFNGCASLTSLDVSTFDTSNATALYGMFAHCTSLRSVNVSGLDLSKADNLYAMFYGCSSLTTITGITTWDTSNIQYMHHTFRECSSLKTLDLSSWDTSKVEQFHQMFQDCTSLTTIYVSGLWSTESWTTSGDMFLNCTKLVGGNGTAYSADHTDYTYAVIDKTGTAGYLTYRAYSGSGASGSSGGGSGASGTITGNNTYAMVLHYILTDGTAYYTDYAACDVSEGNLAYNYELSDGSWALANARIEIDLRLIKRGSSGYLSGAEFTVQERVGDTWYDVGTLTSSSDNYLYDTVTITCHYDESGNKTTLENPQSGLTYLAVNGGQYRVIETKAPSGYYCPTPEEWSWKITLTETILANQVTQSTAVSNTALTQTAVTVRKAWNDADDYAGIRPAAITVTLLKNGVKYDQVTLNEANEWSYSWRGLDSGSTWTVRESGASGYTLTQTSTKNGLQTSFVLTNSYTPKTTTVTAVKAWADDGAEENRPGSVLVTLYADGKKVGSKELSDGNSWTCAWTGLKYYREGSTTEKIVYTVEEAETDGYVSSTKTTTNSDGSLTVTLTNTIVKIGFRKVDTDGNALSGAVLKIVDADENTVAAWTTDGTEHTVYGLAAGTYTLTEATAPDGYLRAASISFTVGTDGKLSDGTTVLTMTDSSTSVKLLKTDAETGKALAGAKLSVTNAETGDKILSWVSGDSSAKASSIVISSSYPNVKAAAQSDGSLLVTCLPTGEYILTEEEAPDGYKAAVNITFTAAETSQTQSVTIENERSRELQILKTDAAGNAVSGATLALYKGSQTETDDDALVEAWVTDGTAYVLEDIAVGTYTLFELNTPAGYVTAEPVTVTISQESGTVTAVMKDEPIVVTLLKTDAATGKALAGAALTVKDAEGNTVVSFVSGSSSGKASSVTVGTNYKDQITAAALSDGSLKITYLPAGDYTLSETSAPDGYVAAEAVSFTVEEKAETQSVTMEDDRTKVQISKTDLTDGTDVAGAVLTVTDAGGNTVLTWTTGKVTNGTAQVTSVTAGSTYKNKISTVTTVNEDGNWAVEIECLPAGGYTLTETSVPDGYVKAESVSFTVEETGEIQKVEMQDDVTKLTLYKIEKGTLSSETDSEGIISYSYTSVAGATLALRDSAGNLIVRFISGDTVTKAVVSEIGSVYRDQIYMEVTADGGVVICRLPAGTACILTEEETPAGYITGADVTFTTKDSGEVAYAFLENDYTKVAVWKVDAKTGDELPGALLQIIDAAGDVVAEWYSGSEEFVLDGDGNEIHIDSNGNVLTGLTQVTNGDGTVTVYDAAGNVVTDITRLTEFAAAGAPKEIDRLAAGTYTLHEVSAPEDYNLADDIQFRIAEDGTVTMLTAGISMTLTDGVYTITMEDEPGVPVYISKVDETGTPLPGAVLAFYKGDMTDALLNGDKDALAAALVDRWTTDGTEHLIDMVTDGTYTIVEESAPDGYTLATAMVLTIDTSQDAYYFTVVNTPGTTMPSTGGRGLVPGIAFAGILTCALGLALLLRKRETAAKEV